MPRLALSLRTAVAGLLAAACLPAGASAATNPHTGPGVCGPGFVFAKSWPVRSNSGAVLLGELVLSYGPGARPGDRSRTCAVVLKRRSVGTPAYMSVRLSKRAPTPRWTSDAGYFSYYAGPRYVTATPACVNVGGFISVPGGREGIRVEMSSYRGHCA